MLSLSVGFPYFVLSSTGTLLQAWFRRLHTDRSPYPLYAVSNGGSLLALVSYPFVVEPLLSIDNQINIWSWGFVIFVTLCAYSAYSVATGVEDSASVVHSTDAEQTNIDTGSRFHWFTLPACASLLLLAVTNHITQDVAAVPFLWIVPLCVYLLSFILCFESDWWYIRWLYASAFVLALIAVCYDLYDPFAMPLIAKVVLYNVFLFIACMLCHGEVVCFRPHAKKLTLFYLSIAAGGALGGIFAGFIAPIIFNDYVELQLGLLLCFILIPSAYFIDPTSSLYGGRPVWAWAIYCLLAVVLIFFLHISLGVKGNDIASTRNFYGVLRITESQTDGHLVRTLIHGRVLHGFQFMEPGRQQWPTAYYSEESGVGRVMKLIPAKERRVGVIGLGVGTLAAYGMAGDRFRFYEINPEVVRVARKDFYYLSDSKADIEIVAGDALLSMQREAAQDYDVLVLDAFSGDSIPVHLLTREAFATYLRHIKQDGAICVHITNKHLDLRPVIRAAADASGIEAELIASSGDAEKGATKASWIILTQNRVLRDQLKKAPGYKTRDFSISPQLWTNRSSNLLSVITY
ncbi:MAG: fused MFS/spermidine synthase [Mariprofundus sp.]